MRSVPVQSGGKEKHGAGFTLVELIVSISILSLLTAIAIPGFSALQRKAIQLRGMSNLKQIHYSVSLFANDHGDRYPPSVSWIGGPSSPQAYHPRRLVSSTKPRGAIHRSMSGYLHEYMSDVSLWTCPAAPKKVPDMQEMWDAGDDYVSRSGSAAFSGHYCFFWGWTGLIEGETTNGPRPVFRGPRGPGADRKSSSLLGFRIVSARTSTRTCRAMQAVSGLRAHQNPSARTFLPSIGLKRKTEAPFARLRCRR
ncbi:MAG: type II secretion system protein [Planctomycetes bacterium]|nr:type II secretion system protein [Planctomycetota bacterium]